VVPEFQRIFHGENARFDIEPRYETVGPPVAIREAFDRLRSIGAVLSLCTGRNRQETVEPLRKFRLLDDSLEDRLVTQDVVEQAEAETGIDSLSKPHWFPLAAAIGGVAPAVEVLRGHGRLADVCPEASVFVGDSLADFRAAENCVNRGAQIRFVLVESGVLPANVVSTVRRADITVGAVAEFGQVPELLAGAGR
jgi:phosphoglycolate phosphatase-like HAD superfamily hydrolase